MDYNVVLSILLAIIFILIEIEWDDGFMLFLMGFINIMMAINIDTIYVISNSDYQGFGQIIQLIYVFLGIFAFVKIYFTLKEDGLLNFRKIRNG